MGPRSLGETYQLQCTSSLFRQEVVYTTNCWKKIKRLPRAWFEPNVKRFQRPKIRSHQFPIKVMYVGVVSRPQEESDFDGQILLKHVSGTKILTTMQQHSRFQWMFW